MDENTTAPAVEIVSDWVRDDCPDPCHRKAVVRLGDEIFRAHRTREDGYMTIRPVIYDGRSWTVRTFAEFAARLAA